MTLMNDLEVKINLTSEKFTMEDALGMRKQKEEMSEASQSVWDSMSPDYQNVLAAIVRRSVESLHANVEQWLPHCMLDGVGGDKIDVMISIMLSDVEAQVDMLVDATDFEIENAKRRLMEQLSGEETFDDDEAFKAHIQECVNRGVRPTAAETQRLLSLL